MYMHIWEVNNSWQVSLDVVCIRLLFVHTLGAHMPWDWKCVLLCVSTYCLYCTYFGSTHALGLEVCDVVCIHLLFVHTLGAHMPWDWEYVRMCCVFNYATTYVLLILKKVT